MRLDAASAKVEFPRSVLSGYCSLIPQDVLSVFVPAGSSVLFAVSVVPLHDGAKKR